MAIARLWQAGAEFNDPLLECTTKAANFLTSGTQAKTGSYAFRVSGSSSGVKNIDAIAQCRVGLYIWHIGPNSGDVPYIIQLASGTTAIVSLCFDGANIRAYDGTNGANLLASGAGMVAVSTWFHIGLDVKIDVTGWFYAYIDGVEVIGFDGDTTNSGASFNRLHVGGGVGGAVEADAYWNNYAYIDDVWIDSSVGEGAPAACEGYRFTLLNPDGDGYSSDFNGSDGDSVNNYLLVDEVAPDDDTTYVYHDTTGQNDGYTCADITLDPGETISAVIPIVVAKKIDPLGSLTLDIGERLGGVNSVSSPAAPGTDYSLLWERHTTKPGGGAWSEADVNNAEMVIETV